MTGIEIIVAVVFGLWLLALSVGLWYLRRNTPSWEDHERYASLVREMRHDVVWLPMWAKRIRFWRMVWRSELDMARRGNEW